MAGYIGGNKVVSVTVDTSDITGNITVGGTVDGRDVAADGTKLDGVETAATADQTNAEIRTAVEAATDSNVFTDADHTKLNAIEASATADQTDAEIKTAVQNSSDIALAGNPTTTTQSANNNSTRIATTGYTDAAIAALADSAPATLNTLNELAAALGDDANFSTTVTNSIATKLPLAGGTVTGDVTFNTQIGLGAAPHATAPLNITTTNQHIRLNNGSELGVISVLSGGELDIWGNGDGESINFRTGSGSGSVAMNVVGNNVGIGHASPTAPLDIRISGASGIIAEFHNTSGFGVDIGSDSDSVTYISGGYTQALAFKTNAGSGQVERMRISSTGDVIATSGSLNLVGTNTKMFASSNGDDIQFKFSGTKKASINNGGLISASDGSAVVPAFRFVDDPNTGMYRVTTDTLAFSTAGTERMRISNTGALTSSVSGGYFETRADGGGFNYKQTLDVATAGVSITGQSNRGDLGQVRILQAAQGNDGGYIELRTSPNGSTTPALAMKVDNAQNIGIGTSTPTGKVEIQGPAIGSGVVDVDHFKALKLSLADGTEWGGQAQFSVGRWQEDGNTARSSLVISLGNGQQNSDSNADTDVLTLLSNGNAGIGITNPAQLLHVQAGTTGNGVIRVGGGAGLEISHDNSGATTQRIDSLYRGSNTSANLQIRTGTLTVHTGSSNAEHMRISPAGHVTKPNHPNFQARSPTSTSGGGNSSGGTSSSGNLIFANVDCNNGSHYNSSNGKFTAPVTGFYYFSYSLLWDDSYNGTGYIVVRKNNSGSTNYGYAYVQDTGSYGYLQVSGAAVVQLNANEFVNIYSSVAGWHIGSESNWAGFLLG